MRDDAVLRRALPLGYFTVHTVIKNNIGKLFESSISNTFKVAWLLALPVLFPKSQ